MSSLEQTILLAFSLFRHSIRIGSQRNGFKKSYGSIFVSPLRAFSTEDLDQADRPDFCSAELTCYSPQ
eukprot:scaffold7195_cov128-Skeletonema_dohrnii-CCMP3373.AAC.1